MGPLTRRALTYLPGYHVDLPSLGKIILRIAPFQTAP